MKFTIKREDGFVAVDGVVRTGIDLSLLPMDVVAVRWFGQMGDVDYVDPAAPTVTCRRREVSIAAYQAILDLHAKASVVVPESLSDVKTNQVALVHAACAAAITGGFQSSALGKSYTYPSGQTDQSNLAANVLSSIYPSLPANWTTLQICCDAKGVWAYLPHTAAQIQQVGTDGKAAILNCLVKSSQLQAQIAAAQSIRAVQSINW